jgi:hypothetical protein
LLALIFLFSVAGLRCFQRVACVTITTPSKLLEDLRIIVARILPALGARALAPAALRLAGDG